MADSYFIDRDKYNDLISWKNSSTRKPLIILGARQVGKTCLVRKFSEEFEYFAEINFEFLRDAKAIFKRGLEPKKIIQDLAVLIDTPIIAGKTLLFMDEIQQCPEALQSLRYFFEIIPELHVIAAGSLIGFELKRVPTAVGRVSFLHLYPLTFGEFLQASQGSLLRKDLLDLKIDEPIMEIHHNRLLNTLREYMLIGGMPAVDSLYIQKQPVAECQKVISDLINTYIFDFNKYGRKIQIPNLVKVFRNVPSQLGAKFKYSNVEAISKPTSVQSALEFLETAGLIYRVYHTKADEIPLGARINPNRFKIIFLDIGLVQHLLGIDLARWVSDVDVISVNEGAIAEQFVDQEIAAMTNADFMNPLFYWHREKKSSNAEVDFIIQKNDKIIPIEVKRSTRGSLKSLHLLMAEKNIPLGIKTSMKNFSFDGKIRNIPLYAIEKIFKSL
ncbi:AAA family ATPase [bacterium]|nr:AAA family ATPase [bacterium]